MKFSVFGFASLAFFAFSQVIASPVPLEDTTDLAARNSPDDVDVIVNSLWISIQTTNDHYQTTCSSSCSRSHITSWCQEVADHCYVAVDKCKKLPPGHKFTNKTLIVSLVVQILVEIQTTLKFLLLRCGLLGLLTTVLSLVSVLIIALNALLAQIALLVDGLLVEVTSLLYSVLGLLGCLLCTLGLVL